METASKAIKNGPALLSPQHTASLEDLLERLTGTPSIEPAKGLSARKSTAKPGFDKLGSWLEGRLTKFIAGDDDAPDTAAPVKTSVNKGDKYGPIGPFSHFSTISPARSGDVSRSGSVPDFEGNGLLSASSAYAPMQTQAHGGGAPASPSGPGPKGVALAPVEGGAYGGSGGYGDYGGYGTFGQSAVADEPKGTEQGDDDVGELLNPMAALSFGASAPTSATYDPPTSRNEIRLNEDDDEDDLGFGNKALSRNRTPRPGPSNEGEGEGDGGDTPVVNDKVADKGKGKASGKEEKKDAGDGKGDLGGKAQPAQGGWLRGWFGGKKEEMPGNGPIKAKLGEENAMVFDPELKRWVMKGVSREKGGVLEKMKNWSELIFISKSLKLQKLLRPHHHRGLKLLHRLLLLGRRLGLLGLLVRLAFLAIQREDRLRNSLLCPDLDLPLGLRVRIRQTDRQVHLDVLAWGRVSLLIKRRMLPRRCRGL